MARQHNKPHKRSYREIKRENEEVTKMNKTLTKELRYVTRHFFRLYPEDEVWNDFSEEWMESIKPNPKPKYTKEKSNDTSSPV